MSRSRLARLAWPCAAALLALLLQAALVGRQGLWVDEVFSLALATGHSLEQPAEHAQPSLGDFVEQAGAQPAASWGRLLAQEQPPAPPARVVRAVRLSDTSPPLYYLLLQLWIRAFGAGDLALRLLSMITALAWFPLLWLLGRELLGRRGARLACVLLALSPAGLAFATEGRMYALLLAEALVLAWAGLRARRRGLSPGCAAAWLVSSSAGLLTHYFFAFPWAALALWLLWAPGRARRAAVAAGVGLVLLAVAPWYRLLPELWSGWRVTAGWLHAERSSGSLLVAPFGALARLFWLPGGCAHPGVWAILALALAAAITLASAAARRALVARRARPLQVWLLAALGGVALFDATFSTAASDELRYTLLGLPPALLLAAAAVARLRLPLRALVLGLVLAAWAAGTLGLYRCPGRGAEPLREAGHAATRLVGGDDLVLVQSIPSGVLGVARYLPARTPVAAWVPQLGRRSAGDLPRLVAGRERVVLVLVHTMDLPSPPEEWLRREARLAAEERLGDVRVLEFLPREGRAFEPQP